MPCCRCRFTGCKSVMHISNFTRCQRCSNNWHAASVGAIEVQWTHCPVKETSLSFAVYNPSERNRQGQQKCWGRRQSHPHHYATITPPLRHHYATITPPLIQAGWIQAFLLLCQIQILLQHLNIAAETDTSDQAMFSSLFSVWLTASVSCCQLTGVMLRVIFCCLFCSQRW